jgi:predicted Zn-dependent protease
VRLGLSALACEDSRLPVIRDRGVLQRRHRVRSESGTRPSLVTVIADAPLQASAARTSELSGRLFRRKRRHWEEPTMWSNLARAEWEMHVRVKRARADAEQARLAREILGPKEVHLWRRTAQMSIGWLRRFAAAGPAWSDDHAAAS